MSNEKLLLVIVICALVTFGLRAAPFILFDPKRGIPKSVTRLGNKLPSTVMVILVIYCLKSVAAGGSTAICQLLAVAVVAIVHLIKRNTILSITIGTIVYMILLRIL